MFNIDELVARLTVLSALLLLGACSPNNSSNQTFAEPAPMTKARTPITGPVRYVALGDSTGSGVGAKHGGYVARLFKRIESHRPESKLWNYCFSGATTPDVIRVQLQTGLSQNANLITLGIGINDIGHGLSVDEFANNYETILRTLTEKTDATIIAINVPDISSAPRIPLLARNEYQQLIIEFNNRLEQTAARHGVEVFDIYSITHKELALHPEYFSADGFHPSDEGYQLWADQMWPTIARVIGLTESDIKYDK